MKTIALWWMLFLIASCSSKQKIWIGNDGVQKTFNMPYGMDERQLMDVFIPKTIDPSKPLVIMVHGGAWKFGKKEHIAQIQRKLLEEGYLTANINYRLIRKKNKVTYKNQLEDIDKALAKLQDFTKKTKLHYKDVVLLGESAGGHLALLYAYKNPNEIKKVISLSGPTDFFSESFLKSTYFKRAKGTFQRVVGSLYREELQPFIEASPIAQETFIPTLHFQGGRDFLVDKSQGKVLDSILTQRKTPHKFVFMPHRGHTPRLWSRSFRKDTLYPHILDFLMN